MAKGNPNKNRPLENTSENMPDEKVDRRTAAGRLGKFLAYTAPALIALTTAKDACAN